MVDENRNLEQALRGIDERKRATLSKLITGSAFVAPIVASFAMSGLSISTAEAQGGNGSNPATHSSDRRLKREIDRVATHPAGFGLYRFKYLWSDIAYVGVMAQEILRFAPQAVVTGRDGLLRVDYAALGMELMPYQAWRASGR